SVSGADDGQAITFRIPCQSHTRREVHPSCLMFGGPDIGNSRIARKQYPRRSILEHGASQTLIEPPLVELRGYGTVIVRPYEWFPSQAAVQRHLGGGFPRVLYVETDVILAEVLGRNLILPPFVGLSRHQITQRQSGVRSAE